MDKQLARKLRPLLLPEVQTALNLLLEDRKAINLNILTKTQDSNDMMRYQGAVRELDYLLKIREHIIKKAE